MMHRFRWLLLPLLPAPALALAAESGAPVKVPAYSPLRFTEDYSYLSDPSQRTDFFDALKYRSLRSDDPSWYASFGGELRERMEVISHPDFGFSGNQDSYLLQRVSLYSDIHLGDRFRIYVQGISGLVWGENHPAPPVQDNPLDLQYAFIDAVPWLTSDQSLTVRLGRFGMTLGAGRLLATRASPNIPLKFDGAELIYDRTDWQVEAFLVRPGEERTNGFDGEDDETTFWGVYATHFFTSARKSGTDLYYFGLRREDSIYASGQATQTRHTFGSRLFGAGSGWDWDMEGVVQAGDFGSDDIFAWTASASTGYTWEQAFWQPRLGMKFDVASGDTNPNDGHQGTLDPLFFKSGYFNDASLLRPSNLIDLHPTLTVQPSDVVTVSTGVDLFWRYSRQDAAYDPPGFIQVPVTSGESSYLGTAVDLNVNWKIQRHAQLAASYVYFFADNSIRSAGGTSTGFFSTTLTLQF